MTADPVGMTELRKEAIRIVEESRRTHIRWRNFLLRNPDHPTETEYGDVGDLTHHRECIQGYNLVLAVLRNDDRPEARVRGRAENGTWPDQSAQHAVLLEQVKDARRVAFREAVEALREEGRSRGATPANDYAEGQCVGWGDAVDFLERRFLTSEGETR